MSIGEDVNKRNPPALLVGIQIGTVIMENSMRKQYGY